MVALAALQVFSWYYDKTFTKEEIEALFKPITSKYGIRIVYKIGEDFFSPLKNPPIPAGPHRDSKVKPIYHRALVRYPDVLQRALAKYPAHVIKNHLNAIFFSREINHAGFKYGGSYDPFRRIVYLVDIGWQDIDSAQSAFHHEFSSLLLKSNSFFINPWTDHNPKGFKYLYDIYGNFKSLPSSIEIKGKGTKEDYEDGFVEDYGRTDFENDFNEYSAMIFTYPEKFKKIMNQYPRVRGKFKVWLEFYQKIDPIFTEEYLLGKS
jgi:hypothetical protein